MPLEIRRLIREMSIANPLWGAPRVHGELLKLGINIGQTSVAKYMVRRSHRRPKAGGPSFIIMPTASRLWICLSCRQSRFVCSMVYRSWGMAGGRFYGLASHRIQPLAKQITEACGWEQAPMGAGRTHSLPSMSGLDLLNTV